MRPVRALGLATAALCALAGPLGCSENKAASPRYTVRGKVENLREVKGAPMALIHHEAIPDFVDGYGEKRTMASMSMGFGFAPSVALDSVEAGDKVEITFEVDRDRYPTFRITALEELPADAELDLSR